MSVERVVLALIFFFAVARAAEGEPRLACAMLELEKCAFAVSDSGHRCVLEKQVGSDHKECQTSSVMVGTDSLVGHIETDECVKDCGADRSMIGFDSEGIYSPNFTEKLCSRKCEESCLNLVDLYSNIIAGEGITLSEFCTERRRAMLMRSRRSGALSPIGLHAMSPEQSKTMSRIGSPIGSPIRFPTGSPIGLPIGSPNGFPIRSPIEPPM